MKTDDMIPVRRSTLSAIERALKGWGLDVLVNELRGEIRAADVAANRVEPDEKPARPLRPVIEVGSMRREELRAEGAEPKLTSLKIGGFNVILNEALPPNEIIIHGQHLCSKGAP